MIAPYLTNAIGKRQALRLALSAQAIDAAMARQIGLVHEVAQGDALDDAVERVVLSLLGNGPAALGEIKQLFGRLTGVPIDDEVRELTAQTIARVRATDEAREGFAAFLGKRPAAWVRT